MLWRGLAGRGLWAGILLAAMVMLQGCHPESKESSFLAAWSPDGSRAALVSNLMDEDEKESGIWVLDVKSGNARQIYKAPESYYCIHPQWSPFGSELLFGLLQVPRDESGPDSDRLRLSVFIIGEDGMGLRKAAETELLEHSALWPNRIAWGPLPGTIIIEEPVDAERNAAVLIDLRDGLRQQFLPGKTDAWLWEASPSGRQVAALLFNDEQETADVYLSDCPLAGWRQLQTIHFDGRGDQRHAPMISWSPDSTSFVVGEMDDRRTPTEDDRYWLSLFDASTGESRRVAEGRPNGPICWNKDGSRFLFAGDALGRQTGIFLVDVMAGTESCVLRGEGLHPLAWDRSENTISCFRQSEGGNSSGQAEDSCFPAAADNRFSAVTARLLQGDVGWSVSPDGAHALFFGDSVPVVALDLPYGMRRFSLVLTAHQRSCK